MKILLVLNPKPGACHYFRLIIPHAELNKKPEFEIHKTVTPVFYSNKKLKEYRLIVFHKSYVPEMPFIEKLNKLGIKTMIDFDDYWHLPANHLLYNNYKKEKTTAFFMQMLKTFRYVTVTTPLLADAVKPYNKNVFVMPNIINPAEPQFKEYKTVSSVLRFGYMGGTTHKPDIELLGPLNNVLLSTKLNYKLILFGYSSSSETFKYANTLTGYGKYVDNMQFYPKAGVFEYAAYYNLMDVSLIPLVNNKFNNLKSELKLLEAGNFKKAAIVSNVLPYKPFLNHKKNCLVVNNNNWHKKIKYLVNNPSLVKDLGSQLHLDMQKHFNFIEKIKERAEIYRLLSS